MEIDYIQYTYSQVNGHISDLSVGFTQEFVGLVLKSFD